MDIEKRIEELEERVSTLENASRVDADELSRRVMANINRWVEHLLEHPGAID